MRPGHVALFTVWMIILMGVSFAAVAEIAQARLPDAALMLSYVGFSGVCWFISVRRLLRAEAPYTQKPSLVMRVALGSQPRSPSSL